MQRRLVQAALGVLLLGLVLLAGALGWLALHPLALPFLTPRIETALQPADGSVRVEIADTRLRFGVSTGLELELVDLRALHAGGEEILRLPSVAVRLALPELLRGRVAVRSVDLESPSARVVREADGRIDVAMETPGASAASGPSLWDGLLAQLSGSEPPLDTLRRVRIRDADLRFEDRRLGLSWAAPRADLQLESQPDGLAAHVRLDLDLDGSRGALEADLGWERDAAQAHLETRLKDVDLRPVVAALLAPRARPDLPSIPVDGSLESRWRLEPEPQPVEVRLALTGVLHSGPPGPSDPRFALEGHLEPDDPERLDLDLHLEPVDVATLGRWWPPALAGATRQWIVENIPAGRVRDAELRVALRLAPAEARVALLSLGGSLEAEDLEVRYLAPLPEAREVQASARFDAAHWDFTVRSGRVRDVEIRGGSVSIQGIEGPAKPRLALELSLDAPIPTVAEILDLPPLEIPTLDPKQLGGRAEGTLRLALPLEEPGPGDLELGVEADLHDAAAGLPSPLPGVSHGELHLSVARNELVLAGPARLGDRPGVLRWTHHFPDAQGIQNMALDVRLEALPKQPPLDIAVEAERDASRWLETRARIDLGSASRSSAAYSTRGDGRTLALGSPDLGALIEALTGSKRLGGGRLRVDGSAPNPAAPLAGSFEFADFTATETTILGRLLEALGLHELHETLADHGLEWASVSGGFRQIPDGVELQGVRGAGGMLAFSLDGSVRPPPAEIALHGEVVPLRRVNTLVGDIPVVGPLVTGGSEGLVSAHYRVGGTLDDPLVHVDPWSTLVPGPLRQLLKAGGAVGRAGAEALSDPRP